MTAWNPGDEFDREHLARQALSKLLEAVAGIDGMSGQLEGLGLRSEARAAVDECLATALRETERAATDLSKSLRPKNSR